MAAAAVLGGMGLAGSATADLNLNNTTFSVDYFGSPTVNGLNELYYTGDFGGNQDIRISPLNPTGNRLSFLNSVPVATNTLNGQLAYDDNGNNGDTYVNFNDRAGGIYVDANADPGIIDLNNIGALYFGTVTVGGSSSLAAGDVTFATESDDGTNVYIDLNQNGRFEASEQIVNNLGPHGMVQRTGTANLAAGTYRMAVGFYEGGGGGALQVRYASGNNVPFASTARIDPTAAEQAGVWGAYTLNPGAVNRSTEAVNLSGNSTLDMTNAVRTSFGTLNAATGSTLNIADGPIVSFGGLNAAGSTTINNGNIVIVGPISGTPTTITKQGTGRLELTGYPQTGMTPASTLSVQGGTGVISGNSAGNSIGGANVVLNGSTLEVAAPSGAAAVGASGAMRQVIINGTPGVDITNNGQAYGTAPTGVNTLTGQLRFDNDGAFQAAATIDGNTLIGVDNYVFVWESWFTPATSGNHQWGIGVNGNPGNDDDASAWIDLNNDGVFQGTERLFQRGCCGAAESGLVNLTAGQKYRMAFVTQEFGGGSAYNLSARLEGGTYTLIDPSAATMGTWEVVDKFVNVGSDVNVTGASNINVRAADGASFGDLTLNNGSTLTTQGVGGTQTFATTGGSGSVTINATNPTRTGVITGNFSTLNKTGGSPLFLDNTTAASALTGSSIINIAPGGPLVATANATVNPLGGAQIQVQGGGLMVFSTKDSAEVNFGNPITALNGTARVTARQQGAGSTPNGVVTTGPATINPNAVLSLSTANGYTMNVPTVNFTGPGQLDLGGGVSVASVNGNGNAININGSTAGTRPGVVTTGFSNAPALNLSGVVTLKPTSGTMNVTIPTTAGGRIVADTGTVDFGAQVLQGAGAQGLLGQHWQLGGGPSEVIFESAQNIQNAVAGLPAATIAAATTTGGRTNLDFRNNNYGGGAPFADQGFTSTDNHAVLWTGKIEFPSAGNWELRSTSDDGTGIFIDLNDNGVFEGSAPAPNRGVPNGEYVVSNNVYQGATTRGTVPGGVFVPAGKHQVMMYFYEGGGGAGALFEYRQAGDPNAPWQIISNSMLSQNTVLAAQGGGTMRIAGAQNFDALEINGNGAASTMRLTAPGNSSAGSLIVTGEQGGTLALDTATTNLTVNRLDVRNNVGGSFAGLTKTGPGSLTATRGAQLAAPVVFNSGTLTINGPSTGTGKVTIDQGATIKANTNFAGELLVNGGTRVQPHMDTPGATGSITGETFTIASTAGTANPVDLDFRFGTLNDLINVNSFNLDGNGRLNVEAIDGFRAGSFKFIDYQGGSQVGNIVLGTTPSTSLFPFEYSIFHDTTNTAWFLNITADQLVWTGAVNNSWQIGGPNNWVEGATPRSYLDLSQVTFNDTGTNRDVNIAAGGVTPASVTVDASVDYSFAGGPIKGSTGIIKTGSGLLALNNNGSTFTGPVQVSGGGTLAFNSMANAGSPSALGASTTPIDVNGATLRYTGATAGTSDRGVTVGDLGVTLDTNGSATFSGVATGAVGSITKVGTGTFSLSNTNNTLSGPITVESGTLHLGNFQTLEGGSTTLNVGTTGSPATFSYGGPTATHARQLQIGDNATIAVTNPAATLTLNGGDVSGATLGKTGPGTLTLPTRVTFTGTTHNVAGGRINFTNTNPASANAIDGTYNVANGATLGAPVGGIAPTTVINLNGGTYSMMGGGAVSGGTEVISAFGNGTGWQVNRGTSDEGAQVAAGFNNSVDPNGILTLTTEDNPNGTNANGQEASAWTQQRYDTTSFRAKFTYTRPDPDNNETNPADGIFFGINSNNPGALGGAGGGMGIAGIGNSAGLGVNIWGANTRGVKPIVGGVIPFPYDDSSPINLISGRPIDITVEYASGTMRVHMKDATTGDEYSTVYTGLNFAGVAGTLSHIGFSGATGGARATQEISNFSFTNNLESLFNNPVNVAGGTNSTLDNAAQTISRLGVLTFQGPNTTLNATGGGVIIPSSVNMTSGGTYTLNATGTTTLDLGHPNAAGLQTTLNKTGTGTVLVTSAATASSVPEFAGGSVINVNGGIFGAVGGAGSKNPLGAAVVNLNGGELALSSRSGDLNYGNTQITALGPNSGLSARKMGAGVDGSHVITAGSAAKPVTVNAGANLELGARDGNILSVPNLHFGGTASFSNTTSDTDVQVGTITSAAGSNVTLGGTRATQISGPVSVNEFKISQGATAAMNPATGIQNVNAPVVVDGGTFSARSNVVDTGGRAITGRLGTIVNGVLAEGRVNGAFNEAAPNPFTRLVQGTPQGNIAPAVNTDPGENSGWINNSTYIYNGQIFIADTDNSGSDRIAFGESFDDSVLVKVDGVNVLRDENWDDSTSSGALVLTPGWHDVEFRFGQGVGGVGANGQGGWNNTFAFGIDMNEADGPFDAKTDGPGIGNGAVQSKYTKPENLSPSLFRTAYNALAGGRVDVAAGAELRSGALVNVGTVAIGAGGKSVIASDSPTSTIGGLSIAGATDAWTGTLDLKNNDMVLRSSSDARLADYARVQNQLKSGLNEANGAFWQGPGITSSTAATTGDPVGTLNAVGAILNDFAQAGLPTAPIYTEFGGVPVGTNDILMKYTWFGDADLSGVVDGTDYFLIDQAFAAGTVNGGWLNGDFNYSGNVDGTDYFLIDQAFNAQTGPLAGHGAVASAVPEPGVLGLLAVGSLGLLSRRRRRA